MGFFYECFDGDDELRDSNSRPVLSKYTWMELISRWYRDTDNKNEEKETIDRKALIVPMCK